MVRLGMGRLWVGYRYGKVSVNYGSGTDRVSVRYG